VLLPIRPFRTELLQDRLNRRIGFQHRRTQQFAKLAPGLAKPFPRGLHGGIRHCFLMRGAEPGALIVREVGKASAAFVLKRAKRFVRSIGRLGREAWRELGDASKRGDEEEIQFRFHLFVY
jgi:hypothetical protein